MTIQSFEKLKLHLQYFDPIEVTDQFGTRQGQFISMHNTDNDTFGFLNSDSQKQEILKIENTEIRLL